MLLSVIIPTANNLSFLKNTVKSLEEQSLDKNFFEVLIMDESSNNLTFNFVDDFKRKSDLNLKYYYHNLPGLHVGRNEGARKASGDILIFLDDDILASQDYLKNIYECLENDDKIVLMTGKILPKFEIDLVPEWIQYFWKEEGNIKYLWELSLLDAGNKIREISSNFVFGCNFIIKKDIFISLKGSYPDIFSKEFIKYSGAGETLLANEVEKKGYKIIYYPDALIYHVSGEKRLNKEYFFKRHFIMGIQHSYQDIRISSKKIPVKKILKDFFVFFRSLFLFLILIKFVKLHERIKLVCNLYYLKGKLQHKFWVLKDNELFDYILRDNYFDEGKEFINTSKYF